MLVKKMMVAYAVLVLTYVNAATPKFIYCNAYEAIKGANQIGRRMPGQFDDIDNKVSKLCDEGGCYAQCLYLDKLGGQRLVTPDVNDIAQKWIQSVYPS